MPFHFLSSAPDVAAGIRLFSSVIAAVAGMWIIHQLHRNREALRESEGKFRILAEQSPNMVFINRAGKIVYVNTQCVETMGYSKKEFYAPDFNFLILVAPEHKETVLANYRKHQAGQEVGPYDYAVVTKGGKRIEVILTTRLIDYKGGKAILGTMTDITERKKVEDERNNLLESVTIKAREWQDTFDAVPDFVMLLSPKHEFIRVNKATAQSFGKTPAELVGKKCYEIVHGLDHPIEGCPCVETLNTKTSRANELIDRGKTYCTTSALVFDANGDIKTLAHTLKDITDQKDNELRLIAQDRLVTIGQMVSGVAHELNNPLTSVLGFSELLLQKELPEDVKDDLTLIRNEAQRTAGIVKGLLTFARMQSEEKKPHNVNHHVRQVLALRRYQLQINNINVIEQLAEDLPAIFANGHQLQQIFLNIIVNAEQAIPELQERGNIMIKTEQRGKNVRISIADDGPGIKPENMKRIFSPFFTTKEVGKGTGLGLSICQGIISEHDGNLWVESVYGKGATFIIELPVAETVFG